MVDSKVRAAELKQALMEEARKRADENPVILVKLAALLLARENQSNPLGQAMLEEAKVSVPEASGAEAKALSSALLNEVTYILGPQESGSAVLSNIAYELYRSGRSVLVVSESEPIVNQDLAGVAKDLEGHLEEGEPFPVFRLGAAPKGSDRRMGLKAHQKQVGRELYRKQEDVLQARKGLMAKIHELQEKVDLRLALRDTPLDKLAGEIRELDSLENSVFNYTAEKERKAEEVASIKRQYPDWQEGARFEERINKLDREAGRLEHIENGIREKEHELNEVREEQARHQKIASLREELESHPAVEELQAAINTATEKIEEAKKNLAGFKERRTGFQEIIQEFESKSSLVKLFASKKGVEDAQENIARCDEAIEALDAEIAESEQTLADAKTELETCEDLKQQIDGIETVNTPEYCEQRIGFLQSTLETRKKDIPQMEERRAQLAAQKQALQEKMAAGAAPYNRISELNAQIEEAEKHAEEFGRAAVEKAREVGPVVLKELEKLGESTALLENNSAQAIYHKLVQVHRELSESLANLDVTGCRMKIANLNKAVAAADKSMEDIESRFGNMDAQTVWDARIIGTTIEDLLDNTKQAEALQQRMFDTVIVDEAAKTPIPALWAFAYLAEKSLVLVGDARDSLAPAAAAADDVEVIRLDAFDETLEEEPEKAVISEEKPEVPAEDPAPEEPETEAAEEAAVEPDEEPAEEPEAPAAPAAPPTGEDALALFNLRPSEPEAEPHQEEAAPAPKEPEAPEIPKEPKAPEAVPARKPEAPVIRAESISDSERAKRAKLVAELFGEDLIPETRAQERRAERMEAEAARVHEEEPTVAVEEPAAEAAEAPAAEPAPAAEQETPAAPEAAPETPAEVSAEEPAEPAEDPSVTRVVEEPAEASVSVEEPSARGWMDVDIFEYSGMRRKYELGEEAGNLIVLE